MPTKKPYILKTKMNLINIVRNPRYQELFSYRPLYWSNKYYKVGFFTVNDFRYKFWIQHYVHSWPEIDYAKIWYVRNNDDSSMSLKQVSTYYIKLLEKDVMRIAGL